MPLEVVFTSPAVGDLDALDDVIARDNPVKANAFVRRLQQECEGLCAFPRRGVSRADLAEGLRLLFFERRVIIAYRVDDPVVTILRVFYAGLDFEEILSGRGAVDG